jgi:SAM-dependent methyltransferase
MMKFLKSPSWLIFIVLLFVSGPVVVGQNALEEPWEKEMNSAQPPSKVLPAIGVKPGMTIGEIGAGRGRYTVFLAKETGPKGKVLANDIDEISLAYLRGRCRRSGITNVETITGKMDDPLFPDNSLDMAFMVLVYHMLDHPDSFLANIRHSLKSGASLIILDPIDSEIDREFGIDRSKPDVKTPTIRERIDKSAKAAGYEVVRVETFLPRDLIFVLKPVVVPVKKSAGAIIRTTFLTKGIEAAQKEFLKIKSDTASYDLSEKAFRIIGSEFIGSRSYPEAAAVLEMGIGLYPASSKLLGELGEVYLMTGDKEKARSTYKRASEIDPQNFDPKFLDNGFDAMFDQLHPAKK